MKNVRNPLFCVFVLFLTACSSLPADSTPQIEVQQPTASAFEGKVDVDGHEMYLHCVGTGTPTVILEAGFNDVSDTWSLVQPEIASSTRTCAYDRAGLHSSGDLECLSGPA